MKIWGAVERQDRVMPTIADLLFRTVDGVFAVDAKERVIFWNPGCARLFGVSSEEALGRPCGEVVRGKDPLGQPFCSGGCCVARLPQGGNVPKTFPLRVPHSDGEELRLSVSVVMVPSRRKDLWTCVHLLHKGEVTDVLGDLEYAVPQRQATNNRKSNDYGYTTPAADSSLTAREHEVLQLLAEGLRVSVISRLLNISRVTVRNHVQHIQAKLGVHSQVETVAYAYRHNLV